jgi:hypothetical protein
MAQCTELGNDKRYHYVGTSKLLVSSAERSVAERWTWYITWPEMVLQWMVFASRVQV